MNSILTDKLFDKWHESNLTDNNIGLGWLTNSHTFVVYKYDGTGTGNDFGIYIEINLIR